MRILSHLRNPVCSLLLGLGLACGFANTTAAESTLSYRWAGPPSTFDYSTSNPNDHNWIGLYRASGGGPDQQQHVEDSLAWAYTPSRRGSVRLSTSALDPGEYKAYFLADGGYRWLADPIHVTLRHAKGSLSVAAGPLFTFTYSTASPKPKNWIGIYHAYGGGPDDQEFVAGSLVWDWAPSQQGTVHLPVSKLQPGRYKAYLLEDGGYKWAADPVDIFLPGAGSLEFIVSKFKTINARRGEFFQASVYGLVANPQPNMRFIGTTPSDDANWLKVSTDGQLFGSPDTSAGTKKLTVEAIGQGSRTRLEVSIQVVDSSSPLLKELSVLSYNLWYGGTRVRDYHRKQVRFLSNSGADVVGVQESSDGHAIRLASALGWHYWQGNDVGIISRYPIAEVYPTTSRAGAVRISLGGKQVVLWNAHLGFTPYGPHDFCFDHMEKEIVLTRETQSRRTEQIKEIVGRMKDQLSRADDTPVLLTGDFNAPSHLDWTEENRHCGQGRVAWPSSIYPNMAGLIDAYREVHRDARAEPGITWSPIYLDNNGRSEPKDRIDFVYYKGLEVLSAETVLVGRPEPEPNHVDNEWTSDHAAVKAVFSI